MDWKMSLQLHELPKEYIPYWGYNDIFHKAGIKLSNCFFVMADTMINEGREYFKYSSIKMLSNFSLHRFLKAMESQKIYIDIDARTGHNHGTKFRIKSSDIPLLYETQQDI